MADRRDQAETRVERDTFGEIHVPASAYWGAQTQRYAFQPSNWVAGPACLTFRLCRSIQNFDIGGDRERSKLPQSCHALSNNLLTI